MSARFDRGRVLVVVRGRVWGSAGDAGVQLAVDTGAAFTLLAHDLLRRIGYDPSASDARVWIATVGSTAWVPQLAVERIAVLGHQRAGFTVLAHALPPNLGIGGLVGLDFLRDHRLTIDFRAGVIALD
jgi:predicted aspartyl protease